jgi:nitroreductase
MSTVTEGGRLAELVEAMAEAARWAPSVHNTQPWRFRRTSNGLAVHEDLDRALPVLDPQGRLRAVSCGTAVLNAVVAVAAHGRHPRVRLLPDVSDPSLLAVVEIGAEHDYGAQAGSDAAAVPVRRTHRRVHAAEAVTQEVVERLSQAVRQEGARRGRGGRHPGRFPRHRALSGRLPRAGADGRRSGGRRRAP